METDGSGFSTWFVYKIFVQNLFTEKYKLAYVFAFKHRSLGGSNEGINGLTSLRSFTIPNWEHPDITAPALPCLSRSASRNSSQLQWALNSGAKCILGSRL